MKRFINWLRRNTAQQSIDCTADQLDVGVRPEQKKDGEYSDDSSYNWDSANRNESSRPGEDTPIQDECDHEDTVPQTILKLDDGSSRSAEEDTGVDPYNTGRFDTESK